MATRVYVRPVRQEEAQLYFDWASENPVNGFDPQVALYPSSTTWCAYDKSGPLAYQTLQTPIVLESLAPRPGASKSEIALALKELTQNAITQAHIKGVGEIYFLGTDEGTNEMATNKIFEELPYKVFRLRISDLCE
jgi:hypothetical protein